MREARWRRPRAAAVAVLCASLSAVACVRSDEPADRRAQAVAGDGEIVVAAAWPWDSRGDILYGQGLEMAVEDVNAAGGVRGRPLRLLRVDDRESVNEGRVVAQRIAENPAVLAVIGHLQSYVSVPAAAIYDLAGLLMIAPAATDPELTARDYPRVFRTIFTDDETGRQMAEFAAAQGYRRMAIYYVRSAYGRTLANAFEERATGLGLSVVARGSYDPGELTDRRSFASTVEAWGQMELDGIFVAGEVPQAGELIAEMRAQGISAPVLGGDAMSSPGLLTSGGPAVEGTVVATSFHPEEPRAEVREFAERFRRRHGSPPDAGSALGYDAVRLLAHAMGRAETLAPTDVARALHEVRDWRGVTGTFNFDEQGDLVGRRVLRMVVRDGRFELLPEVGAVAAAGAGRGR